MVLEEYESSGMNKSEYCRVNDIPVSTFNYWPDKLDASNNSPNKGRFVLSTIYVVHNTRPRLFYNLPLY